jgi:uncharacterized Zn-binding protein involved in type VI secretion
MGKPAARQSDLTIHGGTIMVGFPTVLIGKMPAARVGDMHICPMLNPGVPPPPHVGGPILPPGAPTVLIGGQPAACVGDSLTCAGPPDTIAPPGCPTVLIGSGGSGGGGVGLSKNAEEGASTVASTVGSEVGEYDPSTENTEESSLQSHFLHVDFVDKAGYVVNELGFKAINTDNQTIFGKTFGGIRATLENAGNTDIEIFGIIKIGWSANRAKVGEEVLMQVETCGLASGTKARLELLVRDRSFAPKSIKRWEVAIENNKVAESWTAAVDEQATEEQRQVSERGGFTCPYYYFTISVNEYLARSGPLVVTDDVSLKLTTEESVAMAKSEYRLHLCNGEIRQGKLSDDGSANVKNIIAGRHELVFIKIEDPGQGK